MKLSELEPGVQEEVSLKDLSYLELWQSLCSVKQNHLCNFGRGYTEEQFCEIILDQLLWSLKDFLSGAQFNGAELFVQF